MRLTRGREWFWPPWKKKNFLTLEKFSSRLIFQWQKNASRARKNTRRPEETMEPDPSQLF